jgi:glycine/D-amino acid oxidase-like deaminating enzyme
MAKSATLELRVRSGSTVWQRRRLPPLPVSMIRRDTSTDVVVVGAGISGALVAESLSEAGLGVIVVDKGRPIAGSTSASTALLQYDLDVPLHRLTQQIGHDRAYRLWQRSRLALDALGERTQRLRIAAHLARRDSLYLQGTLLDADGLQEEARARRAAGFDVQLLRPSQVRERYGIAARAALLGSGCLSADPRQLAAGYLRQAIARGSLLCYPARVSEVEPGKTRVLAKLAHGPVIRARHLVFASGYEIPKGVPRKGHKIASTWAMATRPQRGWPSGCLIWEASEPYLYLRMGPEGRVICGGEDEDFRDEQHRDELLPAKLATLQRKLARLLPRLDSRADYAWAGSFGLSPTGTPSIGAVPRMPNCYAVLGYGGNGITFSMLAAQLLRGLIGGDGDADAELFAFTRDF